MNSGWKCPNCGKAHAPEVLTCPEPASIEAPVYPDTFERRMWDSALTKCHCGKQTGTICGNVNCPWRMQVTCKNDPSVVAV